MKNSNKLFIGALVVYFALIVPTMGFPQIDDLLSAGIYLFFLLLCIAIVIASIFIHELGHLIMGRVTGYDFESFRAGTFIAYRDTDGKIQTDTDPNADGGGQCLMRPPARKDFKFFWYIAGGVIFNLMFALILLTFYLFIRDLNVNAPTFNEYLIRSLMKLTIFTGVFLNAYMVIVNWMPLKIMMNDGYQWRRSRKNPRSLDANYYYLLINSDLNRGASLRDYDLSPVIETVDNLEDMVQLLCATYIYEQLILQHKFEEAYRYMNKYMAAAKRSYTITVPHMIYLDYYLVSLLYFEGNTSLPFTKDHQKMLDKLDQSLNYAFLKLLKHYCEHDRVLDEEVYEKFLKVCRKQVAQTVVAEYLSLFTKIVSKEQAYTIKEIDLETVWQIRHEVMWPEKDIDYVTLDDDPKGVHLGLVVDDVVVSIISIFEDDKEVQFRKFATRYDYQNKGYGTHLLNYTLMLLRDKKLKRVWCNARIEKSDYYRKFGLKETKQIFEKDGQHYVVMELKNHRFKK